MARLKIAFGGTVIGSANNRLMRKEREKSRITPRFLVKASR